MREQWTDERLDDLGASVTDGFNRVDADLRAQRLEFGVLRAEMNSRFDAMQRTMLQLGGGITAAIIGMVGVLAAKL